MPRRGLVLTSSLLLLLAGALAGTPAVAQEGGAAPPAVGEKVKLAVALAKGAKLGFEQKVDIEQNMNMGGMEIPTQIGLNSTWVDTCEAVDESGVATVRTKYVRVHGNFSNPMMGEFPFDSDKPAGDGGADEGNPMAAMAGQVTKAFTAMAQMEIEARIGGDGTLVSAKMLGDAGMPGMNAEDMAKQMGGLGTYPKDPVGVGDSWTNESTMSAGMGMKLKTKIKNTVKAIAADTVTLSQEGEISKMPGGGGTSDDPQQAMMMQMMEKMTLESTKMSGTMSLSRKDGRVLSAEMDTTVKMSVPESEGGGMTMEQKMKMKISRLDKLPEAAKKEGAKAPETPAPAPPTGPGAK
jgi:hypothetical protein